MYFWNVQTLSKMGAFQADRHLVTMRQMLMEKLSSKLTQVRCEKLTYVASNQTCQQCVVL